MGGLEFGLFLSNITMYNICALYTKIINNIVSTFIIDGPHMKYKYILHVQLYKYIKNICTQYSNQMSQARALF